MQQDREPLLVADSFRVCLDPLRNAAATRGLKLHFTRFRASALKAAAELRQEDRGNESRASTAFQSELDQFLADSMKRIAEYGEGWPRLEYWAPESEGDTASPLRLSLRALPQLGESLTLKTAAATAIDHRDRKGPNISKYRLIGAELGAEGLLLNEHGAILEGTTTSLLWWSGGMLHRSMQTDRVPSVTEALIIRYAAENGALAAPASVTPDFISKREVWAVNALHGIRVVTRINGVQLPEPDEQRLARFRAALDLTWQHL